MMSLSQTRRSRHNGSALILTIFVIVVVGFLALMATKNQQKTSTHIVTSIIGARTNMAAQSGIQLQISDFYMQGTGSCYNSPNKPTSYTFNGEGLSQCTASVSCNAIGILDSGLKVYQLVSTAQCQFGTTTLQRVIEVGIRQ
ncbi:MSHA biogenesis protein MshP [Aliivibrio sp. S3MY1]|uniref:MSHA biogenesis protein MshP n=1 Tax=unclassified Aliivibrio TaxID=2645654 RepID=UPI002379B0E9|nr:MULTISPECIES: MSHA biogenesis protein MshP [unclassified Aliivibrio]MDD9196997.1 MSHA biogenesis protein MshP [Aliivibrio sp. S3MY1]MDD9198089.1 MSHA biogenesis protein MshP [Aliivibrio sp. S2MY1]